MNAGKSREVQKTELDGKLRTNSIRDIYEAVRASQQTAVRSEMRDANCPPAPSPLVLTHARPFNLHWVVELHAVRPPYWKEMRWPNKTKNKVSVGDVSIIIRKER
jgi:hypothetical protein